MTKRKRILLAIALAAIVLLVAGAYLLAPPAERISTRTSRKIVPGMTLEAVEAILGGPPGDYRDQQDHWFMRFEPPGKQWHANRCSIIVHFDAKEFVENVVVYYPGSMRPSWYRGLQEWLPLSD